MEKRLTVVGNWKMNGSKSWVSQFIKELYSGYSELSSEVGGLHAIDGIDVILCPPFIYLEQVSNLLKNANQYTNQSGIQYSNQFKLGAQNAYCEDRGAYTGEISPTMLLDVGCEYVILGHSERRHMGETNALIARKFLKAYDNGLTPILCVGETQEERELGQTSVVIQNQLQAVLELNSVECFKRALIAYEPIWAIGTGLTATPAQAEEVHAFIRACIAKLSTRVAQTLRILYGGSVKSSNASELFKSPQIAGGLIGGASLQSEEFLNICRAAAMV